MIKKIEEIIKSKDEAFRMIIDLGYDYDGCNKVESLKGLIDELVSIARIGLKK